MRIYSRILAKKLIEACFKGKILMLVGARQTGKTTPAGCLAIALDKHKV